MSEEEFFEEKCLSECPLECYFDQFDTSLSFIELIPNYQFLNNGYGIEVYNLCKSFDHMFVLMDPDIKSISLKISDIVPDESAI